ncbi:uncharacterized protein SCHCODRAFT_02491901 [Schizophyllum commune H4-8]|uniref:Uncharacterized protein n=1 Tax=Schizophyllum commune (strain H4-8 / FGSC 9210) TaxID=578458 RepID=D8PYL9_SCHCM|nr:uncharacterized protein SCHCODRAFT_02491901 [Schizophyllum commune H4-8]KAI5896025.1 hypothetical protein SCHCODRAFT_02491901 [Schizophyllum commune H4-8]
MSHASLSSNFIAQQTLPIRKGLVVMVNQRPPVNTTLPLHGGHTLCPTDAADKLDPIEQSPNMLQTADPFYGHTNTEPGPLFMSSSGPFEQPTSQSGAYEIISKALADKNAAESALLDVNRQLNDLKATLAETDKDLENSRHRTQFFVDKVKEKDEIIDDRELEILHMYFVLDSLVKDWSRNDIAPASWRARSVPTERLIASWTVVIPYVPVAAASAFAGTAVAASAIHPARPITGTNSSHIGTLLSIVGTAAKLDMYPAYFLTRAMDNNHNASRDAIISSLQNTIAVLTEALRKEQATHERTQRAYLNARAKLEFLADGWQVPIDNPAAEVVISMDEALSDAQEFCARTKDHADAMLEDLQKKGIHD